MKTATPYIIIAILVGIICLQNCKGTKSTKKVTAPEVHGSLSSAIPYTEVIEVPVAYTVKDTAEINRLKKLYNLSQDQIDKILLYNQSIKDIALQETDSLKKNILQLSQYQEFSNTFENDTLKALVTGLSKGTVERLAIPEFTIKKRTIEVTEKQLVLRVIAGGEVGINKALNQGTWKANLTIQDKNNNLWSGSFQRIGNQDYYLAGVQKSIFSIKK